MFHTTTVQPWAADIRIDTVQADIWLRFGDDILNRTDVLVSRPGVVKKLLELLEPYKDYP